MYIILYFILLYCMVYRIAFLSPNIHCVNPPIFSLYFYFKTNGHGNHGIIMLTAIQSLSPMSALSADSFLGQRHISVVCKCTAWGGNSDPSWPATLHFIHTSPQGNHITINSSSLPQLYKSVVSSSRVNWNLESQNSLLSWQWANISVKYIYL